MEYTNEKNTEHLTAVADRKQNPTVKVLDKIYKNVRMGSQSLIDIMPKVKDEKFRSDLTVQLTGYEGYASKAAAMLEGYGVKPEDENFFTKAGAKVGMAMNTMVDATTSHIAEMVIKGSNMGITDMQKLINDYDDSSLCERDAVSLAKEIVKFEEHNLEKVKAYL